MSVGVAAVDLGATSGRVIVGHVGDGRVRLDPVVRFPNIPVRTIDGLHWNILELYRHVLAGLTEASRSNDLVSVGVDSWGVDYGLLRHGELAGIPYHYRDERTAAASERVLKQINAAELYTRTGLQHMPINTIMQLADDAEKGRLAGADRMLLIPDLIGYWLTGSFIAERTIASTTGLLNARTREWDADLMRWLGYPRALFAGLVDPGEEIAPLRAGLALPGTPMLTAVGSHDTASAVVGIPSTRDDFAYISCGTWGIVGVEVERPILTEAGYAARFTNEGGVDARIRFQRNAMGLWVLSETIRAWEGDGSSVDLPALLAAATAATDPTPVFDADDAVFAAPGDMPARIASWLCERGLPVPRSRAGLTRCIIESLAEGFARAVLQISELTQRTISVVHLVGGGSQNALLCQAIADRTGLEVLAGPAEATATGNVLVQARTAGLVSGPIEALRAIVAATAPPRAFHPRPESAR